MKSMAYQHGFTLVELLVSMSVGLIITLAAMGMLSVSGRGLNTVDIASQLRDNGRFVVELIRRMVLQSGYKNNFYAVALPASGNPIPNITGFNDALIDINDPLTTQGAGYNGSDILILRFQASETYMGSGVTDGSMIDCAGNQVTVVPTNQTDRGVSIFHVGVVPNEIDPSLMCSYSSTGVAPFITKALISGVENFQVLYGTDNVIANKSPVGLTDSVPDSYMRADQITIDDDLVGTNNNWKRVRSVRIGMVLRGSLGSAQGSIKETYYTFGLSKFSSVNDIGTIFIPTVDARLRQVITFTVHLRNDQIP